MKDLNDEVLLKDVNWLIHSSCRRNFSNEQKLSTNSKNQVSGQVAASENIECTSIVETEILYESKIRSSPEKKLEEKRAHLLKCLFLVFGRREEIKGEGRDCVNC